MVLEKTGKRYCSSRVDQTCETPPAPIAEVDVSPESVVAEGSASPSESEEADGEPERRENELVRELLPKGRKIRGVYGSTIGVAAVTSVERFGAPADVWSEAKW